MSLDAAYCADGCGRLAERERPMGVAGPAKCYDHAEDGWIYYELVCREHETLEVTG